MWYFYLSFSFSPNRSISIMSGRIWSNEINIRTERLYAFSIIIKVYLSLVEVISPYLSMDGIDKLEFREFLQSKKIWLLSSCFCFVFNSIQLRSYQVQQFYKCSGFVESIISLSIDENRLKKIKHKTFAKYYYLNWLYAQILRSRYWGKKRDSSYNTSR